MKWLGRIITSLVVLFISTVLLAYITPWIASYAPKVLNRSTVKQSAQA